MSVLPAFCFAFLFNWRGEWMSSWVGVQLLAGASPPRPGNMSEMGGKLGLVVCTIWTKLFTFLLQIVFGSIVLLMLWLPIRIIKYLLPNFLPYNVMLYRWVFVFKRMGVFQCFCNWKKYIYTSWALKWHSSLCYFVFN